MRFVLSFSTRDSVELGVSGGGGGTGMVQLADASGCRGGLLAGVIERHWNTSSSDSDIEYEADMGGG